MKKKDIKGNVKNEKKEVVKQEKEVEQDNKKENKVITKINNINKKKVILLTVAVILIALISLVLFNFSSFLSVKDANKQEGTILTKNEESEYGQKIEQMGNAVIEVVADRLTELKNGLNEQIELLSNNILSLKNENETLKEEIKNINLELTQLKAQKPENSLNNIKLLITLIKLKNNFDSGFDYTEDLKLLKVFAKNGNLYSLNELTFSLEKALEKVKNIDVIKTFSEDSNLLISKQWEKQENKFLSAIYKNFSIKKVGNFSKKDEEGLDYKIYIIQQQIKAKKYIDAIETIKSYGLTKDLNKTVDAINFLMNVNNIFNKIIDTIYLGYL